MNEMKVKMSLAGAALMALSAVYGEVVKTAEAPVVDGRLDEPCWAAAKWETGFTWLKPDGKHGEPKGQTSFAFVCDEDNLYLGVRCSEPDAAALGSRTQQGIFSASTDHIEVFLAPDGGAFEYYWFVATYEGSTYSEFRSEGGKIKPDPYGSKWTVRRGEYDGGWTLEFCFPLSAFYMTRGELWRGKWGVNVARARPGEGYTTWRRLKKKFHEPENFAKLDGFPKRRGSEDVWVKSVVPEVKGPCDGGIAGSLEFVVYAAEKGEATLVSDFTEPITVKLSRGDSTFRAPAVFKVNGRHQCGVKIVRAGAARPIERIYPVVVDYQPVRVRLTTPYYRGNFYPGQDASSVKGRVESALKSEVRVTLEGEGFPRREKVLPQGGGEFDFDTKGFRQGSEAVLKVFEVESPDLTKGTAFHSSTSTSNFDLKIRNLAPLADGTTTWIENGNLIVNGKAVFRRNMYAEYYLGGRRFREIYDADDLCQTKGIERIATLEPSRVIKGLENKEARMDVRPCPEYFAAVDRLIEKGRASGKGVYYYISDEPECRGISPVYLKYIYDYVAEKDPYHPVLMASRSGKRFLDCADWFETHPYLNAHFDENGKRVYSRSFSQLGAFVDAFQPEGHPEKCIGCLPTCFKYGSADIYVTFREYVTHVWNFLIHGAKTSWPYAYHDLGDSATLYEGVRFTNGSIARLEDLLLFGRRTVLAKNGEVESAVWEHCGRKLFVVVNCTQAGLTVKRADVDFPAGRWFEFRGNRVFDISSATAELKLAPIEALVLTSEKMDTGLESYAAVEKKVLASERERTTRDNQLYGRYRDMEITASTSQRGYSKVVDGNRNVIAWHGRPGQANFLEFSFAKFTPVFRTLRVHGDGIGAMKVKGLVDGELRDLVPTAVKEGEYLRELEFGRPVKTVKLRLEFPNGGSPEVYEIEMPWTDEARAVGTGEKDAAAATEEPPRDAAWALAPLEWEGSMTRKVTTPKDAKWLVARFTGAERLNQRKYHAWTIRRNGRKENAALFSNVTVPQYGLYTMPLPEDFQENETLRFTSCDWKITMPYMAAVKRPENCAAFVVADGRWNIRVALARPCEGITCSLYYLGATPTKYPVNGSDALVLKPLDDTRRNWGVELPEPPPVLSKKGGKTHPWAKITVLGGGIDVPIHTPSLRREKGV